MARDETKVKVEVWITRDLRARLQAIADDQGRSLAGLIRQTLTQLERGTR